MFENFETYRIDYPLFDELGLDKFTFKTGTSDNFVGKVTFDDGSYVEIFVTGLPAQFYRAKIFCSESGKNTVIETGSGSLSDYWKTFRNIAQGMIVVVS